MEMSRREAEMQCDSISGMNIKSGHNTEIGELVGVAFELVIGSGKGPLKQEFLS